MKSFDKMLGTKFRSRKLILILAFLLLDSKSKQVSLNLDYDESNPIESDWFVDDVSDDSLQIETFWFVDEATEQCLGLYGFGECGDLNLWKYDKFGLDFSLQLLHSPEEIIKKNIQEDGELEKKREKCLGRNRKSKKNGLEMLFCELQPFSSILWSFDAAKGKLASSGTASRLFGSLCIVNDGNTILKKCSQGFTPLVRRTFVEQSKPLSNELVVLSNNGGSSESPNDETLSDFVDFGSWKDPVSGLVLPRNLDHYFPEVPNGGYRSRQVFMGGGVYSRNVFGVTFNIYTMGWYVEAAAAQNDITLKDFVGRSREELRESEDFYSILSQPGSYDRSLFVKLGMTVKKDLLIQGLMEELQLKERNAKIFFEASNGYKEPVCQEGFEILFTWNQAKPSNNFEESLDIQIGNSFYVKISEPGLAEDFMQKFFSKDPVSLQAKSGFIHFFPNLLNGDPYVPTLDSDIEEKTSVKKTKTRLKKRQRIYAYLNSMLLHKRPNRHIEEFFAKILVICYCILLIVLSLPPAIQRLGNGGSFSLERDSMKRFFNDLKLTIRRTLSKSSSLVTLSTPTAPNLNKLFFK